MKENNLNVKKEQIIKAVQRIDDVNLLRRIYTILKTNKEGRA